MSDPKTDAVPAVVNPDLKAVHTALVRLVERLNASIGDAATSAEVRVITDEIADVTSRVNAVGRQLLTQQTDAITKASEEVNAALAEIEKVIEKFDNVQAFVEGVTTFLRVVDKAIGVAKLVV
jgi:cob(I)alamin adenosyltransferase